MKHTSSTLTAIFLSLFLVVVLSGCMPSQESTAPDSSGQNNPEPAETAVPLPTMDLSSLPVLKELRSGWNQIDPELKTTCARGGKYSFFVRKTNSDKLMIYFEGGGSCATAETCQVGSQAFDDSIDPAFSTDNPGMKTNGVFALDDADNPFQDYNMVFVSYCTGDAFIGNQDVFYEKGNDSFVINHRGFLDAQVVLDWTYQNFPAPSTLSVIGCSAGAVGSYFHAPYIIEHYKNIPASFIGDSGGGFFDAPAEVVEDLGIQELVPFWIPAYQGLLDNTLHTSMFFTIPATSYPGVQFALLDTVEDAAQAAIISQWDSSTTLQDVIASNLKAIRQEAPTFRSYTGPGDFHCITMDPAFMDYKVNGVLLRDWIRDLSAGKSVENIAP